MGYFVVEDERRLQMEAVETQQLKGKNWVATMMLAWSFGIYGAHRFYTGKQGTAWAMAILTITGCGAIISIPWAVFDIIMIALGKWRTEDGSDLYERIPWLGYVLLAFIIIGILLCILYFGVLTAAIFAAISGAGAGAGAGAVTPSGF
jgi:TM2 domain-containing membrane protein YozV